MPTKKNKEDPLLVTVRDRKTKKMNAKESTRININNVDSAVQEKLTTKGSKKSPAIPASRFKKMYDELEKTGKYVKGVRPATTGERRTIRQTKKIMETKKAKKGK